MPWIVVDNPNNRLFALGDDVYGKPELSIQALDYNLIPISDQYYSDSSSTGETRTYLDLKIDSSGFIYVLGVLMADFG